MATRGDYLPVDPEDRSNSRLLEDNPSTFNDDTPRSRSNSHDSKSKKCMSMWTFSLIIVGLSVMFLVGVCVGFYVRELQKGDPYSEEICGSSKKKQGVDYDKLGGLHETLVYYIRGEEIREFVSEYGRDDPVTGSQAEKRLADVVFEKFHTYRIDSIDVEEHEITVTASDLDHPNLLEVLGQNGTILQNMVLTNNFNDAGNQSWLRDTSSNKWRHPYVVYSPAGQVQAELLYGHYGRDTDFVRLQALGVDVKDKIVLLRLGKLSVADKVMNCESHGVRGVILYWEPQDVKNDVNAPADTSYIPFASAGTFSAELPTVWRPVIPCQTISSDQARVLMSLLHLANNSVPAPASWQGSLAPAYFIRGYKSDGLVVRLSVFNKPYKQRVQNFISTIQGAEEPDRYVIIGASRASLPGQPQDVVASTSILTQLAHSFHYVYSHHHWKPRRGVKLISWGGSEFSSCGMLHYIKTHQHLLDKRVVAYFDLSQLALGNETIIANIPPGFHQLIRETFFDIPDPRNAEQTLQMTWKLSLEKNNNFSQQEMMPLESYHSDSTDNPFLNVLGVPEVKLQYRASPGDHNSVATMTSEDLGHHYKYHITVTHILVKSLLVMLDNELLPFNLPNEVRALQDKMWQTLDVLEQCFPSMENLYSAATLCGDILRAAEGFQEASNLFVNRSDKLGFRMLNDISMSYQRLFLVHKNGKYQHILYPTSNDGSLTRAADLCELAEVTQLQNTTQGFEETLSSALKNALTLFRFSA